MIKHRYNRLSNIWIEAFEQGLRFEWGDLRFISRIPVKVDYVDYDTLWLENTIVQGSHARFIDIPVMRFDLSLTILVNSHSF